MQQRIDIHATLAPWARGVNLTIVAAPLDGGAPAIGLPLTFRKVEGEEINREVPPTVTLRHDEAQRLMDELWRVGFRPSEGTGSAGALAATERHLQDLRSLVFKIPAK